MATPTSGAAQCGLQPLSEATGGMSWTCRELPMSASFTVRPPLKTSTLAAVREMTSQGGKSSPGHLTHMTSYSTYHWFPLYYSHKRTGMHTHVHTHARTHARTHAHTHTHTRTHTHTYVHVHVYTHSHAYNYVHVGTHPHIPTHPHTHTLNTHTHTHTPHTHTHTHTHTRPSCHSQLTLDVEVDEAAAV